MQSDDLIREAIAWAERGIPVFPCGKDKSPLTQNGFYDAEVDPSKVRQLFEFYGNAAAMIGGRMGDGIFAVDVDIYKGEDVKAWLKSCLDDGTLVETRIHETVSGGLHFLYEGEARSCAPRHGVEIKGDGGYIILPGTPGYTVRSEGIAEAPLSLVEAIRYSISSSRGSTVSQLEAKVLSGSDFHNSLTQIAAKLAAQGMDQVAIQKRLLDLLHASSASQPGHERHARWRSVLTDKSGELSRIAASAYIKFNDDAVMQEAGELAGINMDEVLEVSKHVFTQLGEPKKKPEPEPVVEFPEDKWPFDGQGYFADEKHNLLDQSFTMYPLFAESETVMISAQPKQGKTAFMVTAALHIACGRDLGHLKVPEAGPCLYYALEGTRAIRMRIEAWKKVMQEREVPLPEDRIPLFVVERPANFLKEQEREAAANQLIAADKYCKRYGTKLKLIVIDTLTRAMSGGNQNSVEDTSALFDIVSKVRAGGVSATIVFVHHKARQGNVRGSSNLEAEPDMLLDVEKKNDLISVRVGMARSIEDGGKYHFVINNVDLGKTRQGHALSSMIVDPMTEDREQEVMEDYGEIQLLMQRREVVTQLGEENGFVSVEEVVEGWHHRHLIKSKKLRGVDIVPNVKSADVQEALHKLARDPGGSIFGDHVIRPMIKDKDVVAFKVHGLSEV